MAKVRLHCYGGPVRDLPELCLSCGAPASVLKRKTFSWFPSWIYVLLVTGLVPFAIVALVLTKRRTIEAPLCEEHQYHWMIRQLVVLLSLVLLIVLGIGTTVALAAMDFGDGLSTLACFGWIFLIVGWLILAAVIQSTTIRPVSITDTTITLVGASEEFVHAYSEQLPRIPADELVSEHWQQSQSRPLRRSRLSTEESDRVQPPLNGKDQITPPDAYREESS